MRSELIKGWHGESSKVKQPSVYQISLCAAIKGGWHTRCAFIDSKNPCDGAGQNNG